MFELDALAEVQERVEALCTSFDPALVAGPDVGRVFDALVAMRRLVDGAVTRMTPRYERSGIWKDNGARSVVDAIAAATGSTPADSRRRLETGKATGNRPGIDEALRTGRVSAEQAGIVAGASEDPDVEEALLGLARSGTHTQLRDEAARARASADGDDHARQQRQRNLRRCSRWTDTDGLYNLHLRTLPEVGAEIDARLKPEVDRHFDVARKAGRHEPVGAYVADAVAEVLVGMTIGLAATGSHGPARSSGDAVRPERKVIALVDIDALNRGRVAAGETCELAGVGPVSVSAVRALFGDAAMAVVFRDAVDIRSVVHLGRQVTAAQRTALEARGPRCAVCGSSHHLEIDHCIGWTYTRTTVVDDLDWLCSTCHGRKTRLDLLAIGPPGNRTLVKRDPRDPARPRSERDAPPTGSVRDAPRSPASRGAPVRGDLHRGPPGTPAATRAGPRQARFDLAT